MNPRITIPCALLGLLFVAGCRDSAPTGPVATAAASAASTRATSEWETYYYDPDFVAYPPCLSEGVHAFGRVTNRGHWLTTPHGYQELYLVQVATDDAWSFHLEGLTTGEVWLPAHGNRDALIIRYSDGFTMWSERFVYRNQTTGAVLDWPLNAVVYANGEVRASRSDDCKLRP